MRRARAYALAGAGAGVEAEAALRRAKKSAALTCVVRAWCQERGCAASMMPGRRLARRGSMTARASAARHERLSEAAGKRVSRGESHQRCGGWAVSGRSGRCEGARPRCVRGGDAAFAEAALLGRRSS